MSEAVVITVDELLKHPWRRRRPHPGLAVPSERNRRGRKRKQRARHANGRLIYCAPNDRALAAAQPHRRALPEALRLSELPATMIGTLYGRSLVTEPQRIAGERYGQVGNQYLAVYPRPKAAGEQRPRPGLRCRPVPVG